jgi:sugar phosphate isomerase/epimerase
VNAPHDFYTVEEIRNRLSMSTVVFWKYRPIGEATLSALARHGIRRIELLESPEQFDMADRGSMRYIEDGCRAFGIRIVAYHAHMTHFSGLDTEAKRQAQVDRCRRQIDTLLALGGNVWGTHATATDDTLLRCTAELARHAEGTGAVLLVENFKDDGLWVEDRVAFLDRVGHPQVGMILDIGHVRNREGANPMTIPGGPERVVALCRRHLRHVHLHGFREGVDHYPAFAEGDEILWVELFRALRASGYGGHINFESKGEPKHLDTIEATARAPQRIVAAEAAARRGDAPPAGAGRITSDR